MKSFAGLVLLALFIQPLAAQSTPPKLSPEARAAAQSRLSQEASTATSQKLDAAKQQLRDAVIIMRDSIETINSTAALIRRAQATKSVGVELSQARHLSGECAAAQRTAAATLTKIASLHTDNAIGIKLLDEYRGTLEDVRRATGDCQTQLATIFDVSPARISKLGPVVDGVVALSAKHSTALRQLMGGMEIYLRP